MVLHSILSTQIVLHLFTVSKQDLVESRSTVMLARHQVSRRIQFRPGRNVVGGRLDEFSEVTMWCSQRLEEILKR